MRIFAAVALCAVLGTARSQGVGGQKQQPNPCDSRFNVVGDVTYCDMFWECVGGTPQQYHCPNGLAFVGRNRGIADGCDYPWRGSYCINKQMSNPPLSTEHCDWLYGIFGHETSCTRYWTCWNGTATEQFCIGGLLYNEDSHGCDWPSQVAGCQKHPLCKDAPDAKVPLGKSCERYWSCQGGYPRLQRCAATLVFDKVSRRCVQPPTDDCDIPSTTPAPEEERQPLRNERPAAPRRPAPPPRRQQIAEPIQDDGFLQDIPAPQQIGNRPAPIPGAIPLN
ncbi:protein obstructor-E-like [Oratosquilla oratoria]|uniref:protein obstructor-E-like n=1 Tax=Oratosquilla oratoria TaxID=337810 RepID=UPI003F763E28